MYQISFSFHVVTDDNAQESVDVISGSADDLDGNGGRRSDVVGGISGIEIGGAASGAGGIGCGHCAVCIVVVSR